MTQETMHTYYGVFGSTYWSLAIATVPVSLPPSLPTNISIPNSPFLSSVSFLWPKHLFRIIVALYMWKYV